MAGHSKWANIKHKKAAQDAKRGKVFTRLAKEITVSAKLGGGDETSNPRLRAAVLKARAANMPRDNIDRAVKKGTGELEDINFEELMYEGYTPGGAAVIVEVMTDKKTRTLPEIKNIFSKAGGSLGENGSVSYLFDYRGVIIIEAPSANEEDIMNAAVEAGADDFEADGDDIYVVYTTLESFHQAITEVSKLAEENKWEILESGLKYIAQANMDLPEDKIESAVKMVENLENHDDVQNVFTNLNMPEEGE